MRYTVVIVITTRNIQELAVPLAGGSVAAWGNFDGVHLGHRALLGALVTKARHLRLPSVAVTFDPHPAVFFRPEKATHTLTGLEDKLALLASLDLDYTVVLTFDAGLARQTPREFVHNVLVCGLRVKSLVLGYDAEFGQGREGDITLLRRLGTEQGFSVEETPALIPPGIYQEHGPAASTTVRNAIRAGDFPLASAILGREYSVYGPVRHGSKRGTVLGFPTANIDPGPILLPPGGVYACMAKTAEGLCAAAVNLGQNPSFEGNTLSLEAHLLDFHGDLYGRMIRLYFLRFLCPERKFSSPEALREQINKDTQETRFWTGQVPAGQYAVLFPL